MTVKMQRIAWLLLILLVAAFLRFYNLSDAPPGLTHDEADHGLDAWGVVNGVRPIYFTVGYGREPLFDYATAAVMAFAGPTYLAGRLTAAAFGLVLVASTYAWSRRAFDERTALFAAAGVAVGFWAVMTGRQALRSGALPALFTLAAFFCWRVASGRVGEYASSEYASLRVASWPGARGKRQVAGGRRPAAGQLVARYGDVLAAGLLLGLAFYTYIPARLLWLIWPALLVYLALIDRPLLARVWRRTAAVLLLAGLIAAPLFYFLATNPEVEQRIGQLSAPLADARAGNFEPLLVNIRAGLGVVAVAGDTAWRYNIAGRPFLSPLMALLFYAGLAVALAQVLRPLLGHSTPETRRRAAASFLVLAWLLLGLAPVLVTGPELSVTQAIGAQPAVYLLPALALGSLAGVAAQWRANLPYYYLTSGRLVATLAVLLFGVTAVMTARDYFHVWAQAPEVRLQYETALVTAVRYLNRHGSGPVAVSTYTPGPYHSPAVAYLTLTNPAVSLRWFDGRGSLLLPQDAAGQLVFVGESLEPALSRYVLLDGPSQLLAMRPTDFVRPVTVFEVDGRVLAAGLGASFTRPPLNPEGAPVQFGEVAALLGYDLQLETVARYRWARLVTLWQVEQSAPDLVLFTHLLGPDGRPLAQADYLHAPSELWQPGDLFIQLHSLHITGDIAPGEYPLTIGLYTAGNRQRAPVLQSGDPVADHLFLRTLTVTP
jgi:hypothetical protein